MNLVVKQNISWFLIVLGWLVFGGSVGAAEKPIKVPRGFLSSVIGPAMLKGEKPLVLRLKVDGKDEKARVFYTLDNSLQSSMNELIERKNPDYVAVTAIDADSGEVLVMTYSSNRQNNLGNLALHDGYPAASLFKMVTATSVLDANTLTPDTEIPFIGRSTTLYERQIYDDISKYKKPPRMSLEHAFARSVNPIFGRLGVEKIGPLSLAEYAARYGFNGNFQSDIPITVGRSEIDMHDDWSVAEVSSGFTRVTQISPLHAAMMAASVINGGHLVTPYIVDKMVLTDGTEIMLDKPEQHGDVMSEQTAAEMQVLMEATPRMGSARKYFRKFWDGKYGDVKTGGKTGTLTGTNPAGKTDWYAGYAEYMGRRIAFGIVNVNVEKWYIKSSHISRLMIEDWVDNIEAASKASMRASAQ